MDRFKTTVKKIAALTAGAVMVGASVAGALASLDDLPQPFVSASGVFDSYVVVGTMGWNPNLVFNAGAATGLAQDVASGIDLGAAFGQVSTSAAAGTSTSTSVSDGVLIDAAGNPLNIGDDLADVDSKLTDKDMSILADGKFKDNKGATRADTDYKQTLEFTQDTGTLVFAKNLQDDEKISDDYLKFVDTSSKWAYTYTLDFDDIVALATSGTGSGADDLEQTKIGILGKTYTTSDINVDTDGNVTAMTLLTGAVTATQGEYTTQTYTVDGNSYEIEVLIISDSSSPVTTKLKVNGQTTDALEVGDTFTLSDGTVIGVEELLPNEGSEAAGADQVTFYIGADKIQLDTTNSNIKINDEDVKDTDVAFETGGTAANLDKIKVMWQPSDDVYLATGEELVDPVFGSFKFVFAGLKDVATEDIKITPDGSEKVRLTTTNKEGDVLDFDLLYANDTGTYWGEAADNALHVVSGDKVFGATDIEDLQGERFLYDFNDISHLVEITNIDAGTNKISFQVDGSEDHSDIDYTDGSATTFTFMDADFQLLLNETNGTGSLIYTAIGDVAISHIETENGANITFNGTAGYLNVTEVDSAATVGLGTISVSTTWDSGDDELGINTPNGVSLLEKSNDDKDNKQGRTTYGTFVEYYTKDQGDLNIAYPDEEVTGMVYVSPTGATTTTTTTSGAVDVHYINAATGVSRTDQDFATAVPTKNVILVGGPQVNELVNDLATSGETQAAADYTADTAIVQVIEDAYGSYDAMIIAGHAAKDTSLASKVVAARLTQGQFSDKLTGDVVEINTAGASTVNEVTFA